MSEEFDSYDMVKGIVEDAKNDLELSNSEAVELAKVVIMAEMVYGILDRIDGVETLH